MLERLGVPTVTVCSDVFASLAREEAKNLGMPDLPLAIIPHPLGGESEQAVAVLSQEVEEQIINGLTREP